MAYQSKSLDLTIIHKVLPEYEPISKAGDQPEDKLYKAIDSITGDIYLIKHPAFWQLEKVGACSRMVRPTPELVMTHEEARKAALNQTASNIVEIESLRKNKNIF